MHFLINDHFRIKIEFLQFYNREAQFYVWSRIGKNVRRSHKIFTELRKHYLSKSIGHYFQKYKQKETVQTVAEKLMLVSAFGINETIEQHF